MRPVGILLFPLKIQMKGENRDRVTSTTASMQVK